MQTAGNASFHKKIQLSSSIIESTARLMKQSFAKILASHPELDITVDQWVIIQMVFDMGLMSQNELAMETGKDAPTISNIIDLLVQKGIAIRQKNINDRRKFFIVLSKKGVDIVTKLKPLVYEFRNNIYDGINENELKKLEQILNKIKVNLSQPQPN